MSLRASASRPSSCSGAMYCSVPGIAPASVMGCRVSASVSSLIARRRPELGQAEVQELRAGLGQHDVAGLQVAVHDARGVCGRQRLPDLPGVPDRPVDRQRAMGQPIGQRLAFEVLHHQEVDAVVMADVEQRADAGMAECRDGPGLAREALLRLRVADPCRGQHLDGDHAVEPGVVGLVDLAHATGPDRRGDLVWTEACAFAEQHEVGSRQVRPGSQCPQAARTADGSRSAEESTSRPEVHGWPRRLVPARPDE